MRYGFIFKIIGLGVALVVVIAAIRGLNGQKMENAMSAIGIEPTHSGFAAAGRQPVEGETMLRICPTRVVAFEFSDDKVIAEKKGDGLKLKWTARDPKEREIDTIAVEKWLSSHCQVIVRETISTHQSVCGEDPTRPSLRLQFVGGAFSDLVPRGAKCFFIDGSDYVSEDLLAAIKELRAIAQFD